MFDLTKSQQIFYGEDLFITVYGDHDDANMYYIVPVPRLVTQDGEPAFSLTKYKTNQGGVSGYCTFDVELYIPEAARAAAEEKLGPGIVWGQFDWVGGDVLFAFNVEGVDDGDTVTPSLYGGNRATFVVELTSDAAVNTFVNAFSGDGSLSPFRTEYQMLVLTKLLGAKARVEYKAESAITYQERYETKKDIWGNKKKVLVEVKQVLKTTDAGDVKVEEGAGGSPELLGMVREWAWSTLEEMVADAVDIAVAAGATGFPVSATASFVRSYSEDRIVEWETPASRYLPKFDAETWKKVYREVDNRELVVGFRLQGQVTKADGSVPVEAVKVTVDYPTRTTDNTFILVPSDGAQSANTYRAPGHLVNGVFDPKFKYRHEVYFSDGSQPYTSHWVETEQTDISILPNLLGLQQVTFVCFDVPFASEGLTAENGTSVNRVFIDFFFSVPKKVAPKSQTLEINGNGPENGVSFDSFYKLPFTNTYTYRVRYQMSDGTVFTQAATQHFGEANVDLVPVLNPFYMLTFNLRARIESEGPNFELVDLNGRYTDPENEVKANHQWGWQPSAPSGTTIASADPWVLSAITNSEVAYFKFNGLLVMSDGEIPVTDLYVQAKSPLLYLRPDEELYSVEVITDRIDWTVVDRVEVNMFQLEVGETTKAVPRVEFLRPLALLSQETQLELEGKRINYRSFPLLAPEEGKPNEPRYYTLRRRRDSDTIVFYYNAEYLHKDGTIKYIKEDKVEDKLQLTLPPDGNADEPVVLRREFTISKS